MDGRRGWGRIQSYSKSVSRNYQSIEMDKRALYLGFLIPPFLFRIPRHMKSVYGVSIVLISIV